MKLLTNQPFSVYAMGGGSRILRRMFEGREANVVSLAVETTGAIKQPGLIHETRISAAPRWRRWHKRQIHTAMSWLRERGLRDLTMRKARLAASKLGGDVVHVIAHGPFANALIKDDFLGRRPLWVSFHDHYSSCGATREDTMRLWQRADRRLVISREMGEFYDSDFGNKPWVIVTDGIKHEEVYQPGVPETGVVSIYFGGLMHVDYYPLIRCLAESLDQLSTMGYKLNLVLRGTQYLEFLAGRSFALEYRPATLDVIELRRDLETANLLYLPIKFNNPEFYLYSLSTKMVGYLASPGAILYHGPENSAAAKMLAIAGAASITGSLSASEMASNILTALSDTLALSRSAKNLAREAFSLNTLQAVFWDGEDYKA